MFDWRVLVGQQGVDGIARVLGLHLFDAVTVVDSPFVAQLALLIENEDVRRCLRTVGSSDGLRFPVVQIGVAQVLVGHTYFHFLQSIADVGGIEFIDANGLGVVTLNRDDGYTAIAVIVIELLDALFVHLGDGAVIACEYDNEDRAGGIVAEAVGIAINAGQ